MVAVDATATYACINGGGKHPQAAKKETFNADVSAAGSFEGMIVGWLVCSGSFNTLGR